MLASVLILNRKVKTTNIKLSQLKIMKYPEVVTMSKGDVKVLELLLYLKQGYTQDVEGAGIRYGF